MILYSKIRNGKNLLIEPDLRIHYTIHRKQKQQSIIRGVIGMKRLYIVTGANGHLGGTIIRMLRKESASVRGLILPSEQAEGDTNIQYFKGDVRRIDSLRPLFEGIQGQDVTVLHTAGVIDISEDLSPRMYDVNVNGTKNMIALCKEYGVKRMLFSLLVILFVILSCLILLKQIWVAKLRHFI